VASVQYVTEILAFFQRLFATTHLVSLVASTAPHNSVLGIVRGFVGEILDFAVMRVV